MGTWDAPRYLGEVEMLTPRSFAEKEETEHAELRAVTTARKMKNQKAAQEQATLERRQMIDDAGGLTRDQAALLLQGLYRRHKARARLVDQCRSIFKLEYDSDSGKYYYVDIRTDDVLGRSPCSWAQKNWT